MNNPTNKQVMAEILGADSTVYKTNVGIDYRAIGCNHIENCESCELFQKYAEYMWSHKVDVEASLGARCPIVRASKYVHANEQSNKVEYDFMQSWLLKYKFEELLK